MKRRVININDEIYGELIALKGALEQKKREHVSLEEVVAFLLQVYKSSEGENEHQG
jgi:predicted CopG family antitoxin